jgi:APA family basic amino acid/polyamine antiporter
MADHDRPEPQAQLSVFDAVAIMVGLVVGVSIFRTPSIVATGVDSEGMFVLVWVVGGLVTLIGALCYAELAAAHPHAGGEYHFLSRAYGQPVAVMFGWARCTIIQTGSIALVAFLLGDYMAQVLPFGAHGPALYAALAVSVLTAVNIVGTREGKRLQIGVTVIQLLALLAIIVFGFLGSPQPAAVPEPTVAAPTAALGLAMIYVLLTYGGWNDAAYLTGELRDAPRNIAKVLTLGTALLVVLYVLANLALLSVLGLEGLRASDAVAAEMMRAAVGPSGELLVTMAIVVAAISTLNATIFTGARVFYALGRDIPALCWMGVWRQRGSTPANAQLVQGAMALALIGMGAVMPDGFRAMVDYTAPVFWLFLLMVAGSLFVLRRRHPQRVLPFRVPLYPFTPLLFCLTCGYMLYVSAVHTGAAALIGLAVLLAGAPILLLRWERTDAVGAQPATVDTSLFKHPHPPGDRS